MKSNQKPGSFINEDLPRFMELGRMVGTVENGANYATHQQRKLRHIAKFKRR